MTNLLNFQKVSWNCIHFENSSTVNQLDDMDLLLIKSDYSFVKSNTDLLNRLSIDFKFPNYFGFNWDAVDECLVDLNRDNIQKGCIYLIFNSEYLWCNKVEIMGRLISAWQTAASQWSRDKVAFHLIFVIS